MKIFKELIPSLLKTRSLRQKGLNELSKHKIQDVPVIVSLTTFGNRFQKVDIAIRSILNQSYLPQKIILNINVSYQNQIPKNLKPLLSNIVELNWVEEDSPHIKLLPTLNKYPHHIIITVDDDIIYPQNLIEKLYLKHLEFPEKVIANHVRVIQKNENGDFKPYKSWLFDAQTTDTHLYLALGFGGVLYPPNIFSEEVFNINRYLELSPKADDLWFKAMELKNNIEVVPLTNKPDPLYPIIGTQGVSLKENNVDGEGNSTQWKALVEYYDLFLKA